MATRQIRIGGWDNELVVAYLEYDDVSMRLTRAHVVNNSSNNIYIAVRRKNDGLLYANTFPPGDTYINIPTNNKQTRIDITALGRGRFDGYYLSARYPA